MNFLDSPNISVLAFIVSLFSAYLAFKALTYRRATADTTIATMINDQKGRLLEATSKRDKKLIEIEYSHLIYIYNFACMQYVKKIVSKNVFDDLYEETISKDIKQVNKHFFPSIRIMDYSYLYQYVVIKKIDIN